MDIPPPPKVIPILYVVGILESWLSKVITAIKSVKQPYQPTQELLQMMEMFRRMVNDCIKNGLENDVSTRIKLTKLCYHELEGYNIYSVYKICAISHAARILANRKTSTKRGYEPRQPYAKRPLLAAYTKFKVTDESLKVPLGNRQYFDIPLNAYVKKQAIGSFTAGPFYNTHC